MKKIILTSFFIVISLSLISCSSLSKDESTKSNTATRKNVKTYFITTNEEEDSQSKSNWVFGESNASPLEEKEEVNKEQNALADNSNRTEPVENNSTEPIVQNNTNDNAANYAPDPNYNMNDIVPGPDDGTFTPMDSSADSSNIVSDPYANDNDQDNEDSGY